MKDEYSYKLDNFLHNIIMNVKNTNILEFLLNNIFRKLIRN